MNSKFILMNLTVPAHVIRLFGIFLLIFVWQLACIQSVVAQEKHSGINTQISKSSTHKEITGTVTDGNGNPVIGVSIILKGTGIGTATDTEGHYKLMVSPQSVLKFSSIGFESKELAVGPASFVNVQLNEDSRLLNEVVAIGYGNARKQDLSGAISITKVTDIMKGRSSDLNSILQGQMPGVTISANGGDPMSNATIAIRGAGSRNGDAVMTVVDGIPGAPFNVEDVETVTVLKDGATAAIYGSSVGSGGVILITTKKAKAGRIHIDANVNTGVQSAWRKPTTITAAQYDQVWADNVAANGGNMPIVADPTKYPYGTTTRTNWVDEVFQNGKANHYAVSLSGGNDNMKALASVSYDDKEGILLNTYRKTLGAKLDLDFKLSKWASFNQRVNYKYSNGQGDVPNGSHEGILIESVFMPGSATVYENSKDGKMLYNTDGTPQFGGTVPKWAAANGISGYGDVANPVAALNRLSQYRPTQNLMSTSSLELKPFSELTIKSDLSVGFNPSYYSDFVSKVPEIGRQNSTNSRTVASNWNNNWLWQTTACYSNTFADKHDLTVLLGESMQYEKDRYNATYTYGYADESTAYQNENYATDWSQTQPVESITEESSQSVFGRLSYSYDDRYFFTGSLRWDASSKLYYKNNSGLFSGLSGSWKISSEKFFKNLNLPVNLLKLRASWGQIGNNAMTPNYSYNSWIYTDNNIAHLGLNGSTNVYGNYLATIANTNLHWERTETTDIGIDMSLLNNQLTLSADYYNKATKDLIEQLNVPSQAGITIAPFGNVGNVTNKGLELSAVYTQKIGEVQVSVNGNIATLKNVVNSLNGLVLKDNTSVNSMYPLQSIAGEPWHSYYVVKTAGIFQTQAQIDAYTKNGTKIQPKAQPGDLIFVDSNNDGVISDKDKVYSGSYMPTLTYGFGSTISWKGFDFSFMFQGISGNKIFNAFKQMGLSGRQQGNNMLSDVLKSWNYDKTSGIPRLALTSDNNNNYGTVSDFYLESGAYLRLKNLSIGYTLPNQWISKIGLSGSRIRLYVNGENLFTVTKYTGFDPEVGNNGVDAGTFPVARVISGGINLNF